MKNLRKLLLFTGTLTLILALSACSSDPKQSEDNTTATSSDDAYNQTMDTDTSSDDSASQTNDDNKEEKVDLVIQEDIPSLYEKYQDYFSVGVAIPMAFIGDNNMKALINKHFNSITAENAMKPEGILNAGNKGVQNFLMGDMYSDYAIENNIGLRGHTLVWHQQTPRWFYRENFEDNGPLVSKEVIYQRLEQHIKAVTEHYNNTNLYAWDVVNEAIDPEESDYYRHSLYYQICGPEYIEKAFEFARKYTEGTDIKLYYNDYNIIADKTKRMAIYNMVKDLKEKGLIDGVGFQTHINYAGPQASELKEAIELFETLGLEISITELDISMYVNSDDRFNGDQDFENRLIQQAHLYKDIFDVCVDHSDTIANVTLWSLKDDDSWLNYYFGATKNWPVLFDKNYQAKYAFWALVDPSKVPEMQELPTDASEAITRKETKAIEGTPVVDGLIDDQWAKAESIDVNTYTLGNSGASASVRTMADKRFLYVLAKVKDDNLQGTSPNPWEQDSLEIFIDENAGRTDSFESDDVQYRINFKNVVTVNGTYNKDLQTAVQVTDTGYIVEAALPYNLAETADAKVLGFDIQVNDDQGSGGRDSMTNWNDMTGKGYLSTASYGSLLK